jgi:signal transduction histidine kinase
MKLRTTFILSLLAILLVMAVPAVFGVRYVRSIRAIALDLRARTAEAAFVVGRVQAGIERLDRLERAYIVTGDRELATRTDSTLRGLEADLGRLRDMGYGDAVASAAIPIRALGTVSDLASLLMGAGLSEQATELLRVGFMPFVADALIGAEALAGGVDAVTAAQLGRVDRITSRAATTTTAALLGALVVAGALALLAARFLTRPLNRLSSSMARVADGAFDPPEDLPYDRRDEVGELFRAFRSMAHQLADLDRMKAEFVSIASHDLKTPVNVISGYTDLLAEELGPTAEEHHREVLDALRRQTRTLSARANQLLEISRIRAEGLHLGLEEINLRHFTAELTRAHAKASARHGLLMDADVDDSAPTFLIGDPDCLRRDVFGNLLDNAIRFSPPGGFIRLRVTGNGGDVIFEIADQGPTIPPETIPHLFDKYYRGRDRSGRTGAGLGLPIAYAGIEAHGGSIAVVSPDNGGNIFRLHLPIHPGLSADGDPDDRPPA